MLHKEFFGLLFLGFVVWVAFTSSGQERIDRFCRPVDWVGNLSVSTTALILPSYQVGVQKSFDKFNYACRFTVWRLFYQKEYNEYLALKQAQEAANLSQVNTDIPIQQNASQPEVASMAK